MTADVLLVVLDTVRAKSCSLYGYDRPTTPGLETLAEDAVRFDHAIAPATWTLPSHSAMFTGRYPVDVDVHAANMVLPEDEQTLAERLAADGYETGIFSANAFLTEGSALERGFDRAHTSALRVNLFADAFDPVRYVRTREHEHGLAKVRELLGELAAPPVTFGKNVLNALHYKYRVHSTPSEADRNDPDADDGAAETLTAFEEWFDATDGPAFACLNFMEAHVPYRHRRRFLPDDVSDAELAALEQDRWPYLAGERDLDARTRELLRALYEGEVRYLDDQLQSLWSHLRATGRWEDTLVVVTSDHGELLGEHDLLYHDMNRLYEPLVHVPLLVKYPGGRFGGSTVEETVSIRAIHDSVLAETGAGSDERPLLRPEEPRPDMVKVDFVGMNQTCPDERYRSVYDDLARQSRAVYHDDRKYVLYEGPEAYVTNDPRGGTTEEERPIDYDEVPEAVREFAALDRTVSEGGRLEVDDAVDERLRQLGYR